VAKLVIEGLKRRYPGASKAALAGIDLTVEDGEVVVLVGPSGCGKSTVLRLIAGLDLPDGGTISLAGRELSSVPPQDRDVAMVFQGYALYPHMSVAENIGFPLKMRGVKAPERRAKVGEAAGLLGIEKLLERQPGELSGGERQRVAMGRALVRNPKIFLFDEPLSNLDAALRTTLRVEVARLLRKLGATAIYVTHDQIEAMTVGDRIAVMRAGEIEQIGRPRDVYEAPATSFVAGFLGTPAINFFDARVANGLVRFAGVALEPPRGVKAQGAVMLGVRPERISVRACDDAPPAHAISFLAQVTASEPLGSATILHCEGRPEEGAERVVVRAAVPGFFDSSLSDSVRLVVDTEHVLWFDASTQTRLGAVRS